MAKERPMERPDLDELVGAIRALADEGGAYSLQVLCLVNRLLMETWEPEAIDDVEVTLDCYADAKELAVNRGDIDTEIFPG